MHYRAALRAAVRTAAEGAGYTRHPSGQMIDETNVPSVEITTPRTDHQAVALGEADNVVFTEVLVRRAIEDPDTIEDQLDADATTLVAAILPALEAVFDSSDLITTETLVTTEAPRLGLCKLTFRSSGEGRTGNPNL